MDIACRLTEQDRRDRRDRWQALAARGLAGIDVTPIGLRLRFTEGAAELRALAELERECCPFATWTVDGTSLTVAGDTPESIAAVHGMFGSLVRA